MANALRSFSEQDFDSPSQLADSAPASTGSSSAQPMDTAQVAKLDFARTAQANRDLQRWLCPIFPAIQEFLSYPKGWDTYDAEPIKLETCMFALKVLYEN